MTSGSGLCGAALARAAQAETLTVGQSKLQLLLDSSTTAGAISVHRVHLHDGADGASPHHHDRSSEAFFVLDGSVELLTGEQVLTATTGDLVVVRPRTAHAFAASQGSDADLLVFVTPGIERFEFFRQLVRVISGTTDAKAFMKGQAQYDTYAEDGLAWHTSRRRTTP